MRSPSTRGTSIDYPGGSTLLAVTTKAACTSSAEPLGFDGGFLSLLGSLGIFDTSVEISTALQRIIDAFLRRSTTPMTSLAGTPQTAAPLPAEASNAKL